MATSKRILFFFDEDPTEDDMLNFMKSIKKKFKSVKGKRSRDEGDDVSYIQSKKQKRSPTKNEQGSGNDFCRSTDNILPTDQCALPTVTIREVRNGDTDRTRKERKLDSRLNRLLKSKQMVNGKTKGDVILGNVTSTSISCRTHTGDSAEEGYILPTSCEECSVPNISSVDSTKEKSPICEKRKSSEHLEKPLQVHNGMYVAMDCEFVGVGPKGCKSALARCTIVDYQGKILCDLYVRPEEKITDYRTRWSGIKPLHMKNAIPLDSARRIIKRLLREKIVIGHAVWNDFKVLNIHHPQEMIRDTSGYSPLHQMAAGDGHPPRSLKKLSAALLGRTIQRRTHSSLEDSLATLDLFKLVQAKWEEELASHDQNTIQTRTPTQRDRTLSETSVENEYLTDAFWPADIS